MVSAIKNALTALAVIPDRFGGYKFSPSFLRGLGNSKIVSSSRVVNFSLGFPTA
jgi:hypothetical protein